MSTLLKSAFAISAIVLATQSMAQIVLYEGENFRGRSVVIDREMRNLDRRGLGDRAGSVVVEKGRWEVCEKPRFQGQCAILRRGNYDNLRGTGMQWDISSVRPARKGQRHDLEPQASTGQDYEFRRRATERTQTVPVRDVRAIMGADTQRCWVERQAVPQAQNNNANLGGAVVGALIGGILGHQVGGGTGKDIATVAGAVGGAAVGNNVGGNLGGNASGRYASQDVQRCTTVQGTPAYYEVTYKFRGVDHRVQMSSPPAGNTIIVNERGEPRM